MEKMLPSILTGKKDPEAMSHGVLKEVAFHDATGLQRGPGGEIHQVKTKSSEDGMTTDVGTPISDDLNSLRLGPRGPHLMEDFYFRQKIFHFDHERIPERVIHARGTAAHGFFENYGSLSDITSADLFQRAGERTEVFVRFSTAVGSRGSRDLARDVRGFATKFYTKQGVWDLVGNNMPVFFIQDPVKFPDLVHALKEEPDKGFPQAQTAHDNTWDFWTLTPESMHMIMWAMSDRAIPRSLRFMEGFGVHTFRLVNKEGKSTFVKFHWKPKLGLQSVTWNEALKISGADPDFHKRDLWQAITTGAFPEWELGFQLFDEEFAKRWDFDILDPTKIIPEEDVPIRRVGRMVLDRWIENDFTENEQVAFCTQNVVPGIDFTNDPLLQGRNFSYLDTQLKRLGTVNFTQIPINRPRCPVHNFFQDGHMQQNHPPGRANYFPNSWNLGPKEDFEHGFRSYSEDTTAGKVRLRPETFADHYSQARMFYHSQTRIEKQHIVDAFTFELSKVKEGRIRERMIAHLLNIDQGLANAVARGIGLTKMPAPITPARPVRDLKPSPGLSIVRNYPGNMTGRKLGVFLTEGASATIINAFLTLALPEGLIVEFIAKAVEGVTCSDGSHQKADENYEGGPSVLYDAVALLVSEQAANEITQNALARDFVMNAFMHNKFIAYTEHAVPLLKASGVDLSTGDGGLMKVTGVADATEFMVVGRKKQRYWERGQVCPETA